MAPDNPPTLGGRYEVVRRLAQGGMAGVYLARDAQLDRQVALKTLHPQFAGDPTFAERLRREAHAAAGLSHPNIVGVYDWGRQGDRYFIVMEYVAGHSLAEIIAGSGSLNPKAAVIVAFEVAAALAFAHRGGIVHRDVKPQNVLLSSDGHVKVTDFGIARMMEAGAAASLTETGMVMGTASYLSPEQATGSTTDARSDLYSLGVVLYEMLAGAPPFTGDTPLAVAYQHVQDSPVPLSRLGLPTAVPPALEATTMRLLAKRPEQRHAGAEELREDLRRIREQIENAEALAAAPPPEPASPPPHVVQQPQQVPGPQPPPPGQPAPGQPSPTHAPFQPPGPSPTMPPGQPAPGQPSPHQAPFQPPAPRQPPGAPPQPPRQPPAPVLQPQPPPPPVGQSPAPPQPPAQPVRPRQPPPQPPYPPQPPSQPPAPPQTPYPPQHAGQYSTQPVPPGAPVPPAAPGPQPGDPRAMPPERRPDPRPQTRRRAPSGFTQWWTGKTPAARRPPGYGERAGAYRGGGRDRRDTGGYGRLERQRRSGLFFVGFAVLLVVLVVLVVVLLDVLNSDDNGSGPGPAAAPATLLDVPSVFGLDQREAVRILETRGFQVVSSPEPNIEVQAGLVFDQQPPAGTKLEANATVTLTVSAGASSVPVPNVVGAQAIDAERRLREAGFEAVLVPVASERPQGEVLQQEPAALVTHQIGSTVTLSVSAGPPAGFIPDVSGMDAIGAAVELTNAGFVVVQQFESSETVAQGLVTRTSPPAGTRVEEGEQVFLYVSSGSAITLMPNLVDLDYATASIRLDELGLTAQRNEVAPLPNETPGQVVEQTPAAGTEVTAETVVTLWVIGERAPGGNDGTGSDGEGQPPPDGGDGSDGQDGSDGTGTDGTGTGTDGQPQPPPDSGDGSGTGNDGSGTNGADQGGGTEDTLPAESDDNPTGLPDPPPPS